MASIQSLGIGSGLLTNELLDDIIAAERKPSEARLDNEQALVEAQISAYGEISSAVGTFSSSLQALSRPSTFSASSTTSSNENLVSATASSVAVAGSYVVEVDALAQNHSLASQAYETLDEVVGTGSLTFRFGTIDFGAGGEYQDFKVNPEANTKTIAINSTNNTLAGIRDAINQKDFGVQATIVDDGSGYRLLFTSDDGGIDNSIELVASGDSGLQSLNYNLDSQTTAQSAATAAGSADLSSGGGLDAASKAFSLNYNGTVLDIIVPSDAAITDTATAVAAVQSALDAQLSLNGFAAGDVLVSATDDRLGFSIPQPGAGESLEIITDGVPAGAAGGTMLADGFDFASNNASFSISIDGAPAQEIVIDSASGSREETVSLINQAFADAGLAANITASLGENNALVIRATEAGAGSSIQISGVDTAGTAASGELGLAAASLNGLDGFGLDENQGAVTAGAGMSQTIAAQNAEMRVNGLAVTRTSNLVAGVISGTTLNLKATTAGPVTITVAQDSTAIVEKVQEFVDAYNGVKALSDELTKFVPDVGEYGKGSILMGDSTLRTVVSGIDNLLRSTVSGMTGSIRSLSEIGITTDQHNDFQLKFDVAKFEKKFASNGDDIKALFSNAGNTTDAQLEYVSAGTKTQPGSYDVEITSLATVASYQGLSVPALAAGNLIIDDNNDEFSINLNGLTKTIKLTQGSYLTADDLAQQIQQQINSEKTYRDGNHSVSVVFDNEANNFTLNSNIYGSASIVEFVSLDDNAAETFGFIAAGEGPFQSNKLAGLAVASGMAADNFETPVLIDADTSFELSINGVKSALVSLPFDDANPQAYNTPEDLIAAISAQINADPAFSSSPATTKSGAALAAGEDFSANNRTISFSLDQGETEIQVLVNGNAAVDSFNGQTAGTIENSLAAIQTAIDSTSLSGQVTAMLDENERIYFTSSASGAGATLATSKDGLAATVTGTSALSDNGVDFANNAASFDIAVDGGAAVTITVDSTSIDAADTVAKVQQALDAAGLGSKVLATLDDDNQLLLSRSGASGANTEIAVSNVDANAATGLGLSVASVSGVNGFSINDGEFSGADAKSVEINYVYDQESELGRLVFQSSNPGDVLEFDNISTSAANKLGIFIGDGTLSSSSRGRDVKGTINGIEAVGTGQVLRAAEGNVAARPGFYLNQAVGNLASSTAADSFRVTVDGITSGAISLGTISNSSPEAVAKIMQSAINNNPSLLIGGVSVKVEYDEVTGGFGIISNSTGRKSSVQLSDLSGNAGEIFGFSAGRGVQGKSGTEASGKPDPSSGMRVEILGGATGPRGSVSFVRGIADQLDRLLDSFLGSNGIITNRAAGLNKELEGINEDRVALDERLARSEERLRASFLANDLVISSLNTTADFLSSQLALLENSGRKDD